MVAAMLMLAAASARAIDDDLAGGFARINHRVLAFDDNLAGGFYSVGYSLVNGPFGEFWKGWWNNVTASLGNFTPIPKQTPYPSSNPIMPGRQP